MLGRKVSNSFNHNVPFHERNNAFTLVRSEPWRYDPDETFFIGNSEGTVHPHERSFTDDYRHEGFEYLPQPHGLMESFDRPEVIDVEQFEEIFMDEEEL